MVLSGAPLFMWRWAVICAAFINNITATFYRKEGVWATPWELNHGEPFQDSSIVVPFGCAALVMLTDDEREKFKATCAMLIFVHYALDHPLYTFAFYSPRTKKTLYRQDCIFLPETFPMREARTRVGLIPEGEILVTYRVEQMEGKESFGNWKDNDPLPPYQDHITGFPMISPPDKTSHPTPEKSKDWPVHKPFHPAFGVPSVVEVPKPLWRSKDKSAICEIDNGERTESKEGNVQDGESEPQNERPRRVRRTPPPVEKTKARRPVKDRWFYETAGAALVTQTSRNLGKSLGERDENDDFGCKDQVCDFDAKSFGKTIQNLTNSVIPDQSKCFANDGKQLGSSLEFPDLTSDAQMKKSLVNKFKENDVTGICFDSAIVPDSLGPLESLPAYIAIAGDSEETAWDLQGLIFCDDDLGHCQITGWGVDHGINIVFYTPCWSKDPMAHEEHASLAEVLSWIRGSPIDSRITDYRSSRILKLSNKDEDVKTLMMRTVPPVQRLRPILGTMLALLLAEKD
jgi:hypothetical protein